MKLVTPRALIALVTLCSLPLFASAADVTVNVRDAATQKPLSGAKVTVGSGKSKQDFYTADDGSIKVPVANPRQLSLTVASDGFAPLQQYYYQRGPSDAMPDHFDFSLEHAISVSGTVVDQNNTPLAGAKVQCVINKKLSNPNLRLGASWTTVTADAMGNWSVAGIPETFDDIQLGAYHRDCIGENGYIPLDSFKDIAALKNGTATLKLFRGTPVTITVTDENGAPIRNATIGYGEDRVASNVTPTEKTNSKGVCTLGIKAGLTAVLTVQAKSYSPELQRVLIGDQPQAIAIKLAAGHLLEGTVLDDKGDPAAKATVYIDTWRGARTLNKRLQTDVDGHFTWSEAPADEVKADVLTANGEKRGVIMKAGDEIKVAINPPTSFKGTVVDAVTGQPVTTFTIALGISFNPDQPLNWDYTNTEREVHRAGNSFDTTFSYNYPGRAVRVIADGYLPSDSTVFPMDGKEVEFTFKMEKGQPLAGKLLNADGSPAHDAYFALVVSGGNLQIQNGSLPDWALRNALSTKSTADGSFSLPSQRDNFLLVVATDAGYVQADRDALQKNSTLTLEPWGRVEGVAMHGTKPAPGVTVDGNTFRRSVATTPDQVAAEQRRPQIYNSLSATTDDQGKFTFERVAPGDISIGIRVPTGTNSWTTINSENVTVLAGKTVTTQVGGKGRTVTGRIVLPADIESKPHTFQYANIQDDRPVDRTNFPIDMYLLPKSQRADWLKKWQDSDAGKKFAEDQKKNVEGRHFFNTPIKPDGSFAIEGIPEGNYTLNASIAEINNDNRFGGKQLAFASTKFTMPPIPGGVSDDPLDIGTIPASAANSSVAVSARGGPKITTLDGQSLDIEALTKKTVLIYVFSPNNTASDALTEKIKPIYDAFGKNENFTILGLIFNADNAAAKAYVADHHIPWTIATIDPKGAEMALPELAGQDFPAAHLMGSNHQPTLNIAPDKLLATVQAGLTPKPAPAPAKPAKPATTIDPNDKLP